jgi:hypothetical protein
MQMLVSKGKEKEAKVYAKTRARRDRDEQDKKTAYKL